MSDRIEAAIEKLTAISSDLKSMLAVHDQRISQQEKTTDELHDTVEKRREELDIKLKDVYDTMRNQDNVVLDHIESLRKESAEQHKSLSEKINKLEKFIWLAIGGGIAASWIISFIFNYSKFFVK
jgi:conjugal transfer/entry exclusion protein